MALYNYRTCPRAILAAFHTLIRRNLRGHSHKLPPSYRVSQTTYTETMVAHSTRQAPLPYEKREQPSEQATMESTTQTVYLPCGAVTFSTEGPLQSTTATVYPFGDLVPPRTIATEVPAPAPTLEIVGFLYSTPGYPALNTPTPTLNSTATKSTVKPSASADVQWLQPAKPCTNFALHRPKATIPVPSSEAC